MFVSNGRKWERSRRLLTPAFHFDVLKPYISTYNDVAELLMVSINGIELHSSPIFIQIICRIPVISIYTDEQKKRYSKMLSCIACGSQTRAAQAYHDQNLELLGYFNLLIFFTRYVG